MIATNRALLTSLLVLATGCGGAIIGPPTDTNPLDASTPPHGDTPVDSGAPPYADAAGHDASEDAFGPPREPPPHDAGRADTSAPPFDAGPIVPPSCLPGGQGMTSCGSAGESCCTTDEVTGGTFNRTYSNLPDGGVGSGFDPATVSDFRLDRYLVTVGRFRQFLSAWNGGWTPAAGAGRHEHLNFGQGLSGGTSGRTYERGWVTSDNANVAPTDANLACEGGLGVTGTRSTWTSQAGVQENLPMNCVNWQEAYAFCIWDGAFLPSEAELSYAMAGGNEQRLYPWGGTDPGGGNDYAIYNFQWSGQVGGVLFVAPVGTAAKGVGRFGELDLAGEAPAWTLDGYNPYMNPCVDCANLDTTQGHSLRGGGYWATLQTLSATTRSWNTGGAANRGPIGFRCARTP